MYYIIKWKNCIIHSLAVIYEKIFLLKLFEKNWLNFKVEIQPFFIIIILLISN